MQTSRGWCPFIFVTEVYLLDLEGRVVQTATPSGQVVLDRVDVAPIKAMMAGDRQLPILGDDPREPDRRRVFSVSPIMVEDRYEGYLYVVLASQRHDSVVAQLQASHMLRLSVGALGAALLVALLAGTALLALVTRPLRAVSAAVDHFRATDFAAPLVNADIGLMQRVLQNLLGNALKHTETDGVVKVAVETRENAVTVRVQDTGCGIPENELERVFDRFYQAATPEAPRPRTGGLGLAILKRILDLHGTGVQAASSVGEGTEIRFSLPVAVAGTAATTYLEFDNHGLEDLGPDFAYEGWLIVDGSPVSTGTFTVDGDGVPLQEYFPTTVSSVADATAFILTIEPVPDNDPAPSAVHFLAGDLINGRAQLAIGHGAAIGTDFSTASGAYILAAPSAGDGGDYRNGIWWLDPDAGPGPALSLPTLPNGWVYEGWIASADGPVLPVCSSSCCGPARPTRHRPPSRRRSPAAA